MEAMATFSKGKGTTEEEQCSYDLTHLASLKWTFVGGVAGLLRT
jgi:hypothetical protein